MQHLAKCVDEFECHSQECGGVNSVVAVAAVAEQGRLHKYSVCLQQQ